MGGFMFLEKINGPSDLKEIKREDLQAVADEVRSAVINRISKIGGHQGPNLGVCELTVAMHYVFDSPNDKIIFDVSHQCYPHKILTGRKDAYLKEEHFCDVTGYTNPLESKHDMFTIGHTSTSVSLALGVCKGRDMCGGTENVIAVIGDGSLSGGEALEALDYAGEYDKNLIIIVNDNDQSIAENHGGIYKTLKKLRENNGQCEDNFFKGFGLDYRYLEDGHDVVKMVELFEEIKDIDHPIVLHIHTIKGKGLWFAEKNRERYHAGGPFNVLDGSPKRESKESPNMVYESLKSLLENDPKALIVNAGTPMSLGFVGEEREKLEKEGRFIDVGIAEENGVAIAGAAALRGANAVFGTFAPFFQRTYDQMSHDVCLNNAPATYIIMLAGAFGMNSNTHIAMCDISMFAHIPNLVYLAPTNQAEYRQMFKYATQNKEHPVMIRVPIILSPEEEDDTDYSILNKNKVVRAGKKVALFGVGNMQFVALSLYEHLAKEGIEITVINPRYLTGLDTELLEELKKEHDLIITLEDSELEGGYGSRIASYYGDSDMRVKCFGIEKYFHTDYKPWELLEKNGISVEKLADYIKGKI